MLRISEFHLPSPSSVVLRLEGRLAGPWVAELSQACEHVLGAGQALKLDLAEVDYLDASALALLSSLQSRGVILASCSLFVAAQLKDAAP